MGQFEISCFSAGLERSRLRWHIGIMDKTSKRPRDANQLAKLMVDIAADDAAKTQASPKTARAKAGGVKGGPARALALTPEQRSEIARVAASARWKKS